MQCEWVSEVQWVWVSEWSTVSVSVSEWVRTQKREGSEKETVCDSKKKCCYNKTCQPVLAEHACTKALKASRRIHWHVKSANKQSNKEWHRVLYLYQRTTYLPWIVPGGSLVPPSSMSPWIAFRKSFVCLHIFSATANMETIYAIPGPATRIHLQCFSSFYATEKIMYI